MDKEKHSSTRPSVEAEAIYSRIDELHPRFDELSKLRDEVRDEIDNPPRTKHQLQARVRFGLFAYAGIAILALNLVVSAAIGPGSLGANLVIACLLLVSILIGLALLLFAFLSTPSQKELSLEAQRERKERLRIISVQIDQVHRELDRTYRELDVLRRDDAEGVEA
jgi:hypothetical protein